MKLSPPREAEIQRAILELLQVLGIPAWRANTGAIKATYQGRDRFVRFGPKGQADILGVLPPLGRALAVEVKRPGKKASMEQEAFLNLITRTGGLAFVATCPNDVVQALARAGWEAP